MFVANVVCVLSVYVMDRFLVFVHTMFIIPTLGGSVYAFMCVAAV
jgi:hypothetical protein